MTLDKTQVKRELDDAVDVLGWADALKHLADKARAEGEKGLGATLHILADTFESDLDAFQAMLMDE